MKYLISQKKRQISLAKVLLVIMIALYMFYYVYSLSDWHFIDNVNLIFHEAGHIIFGFFGEFIHVLGGTLMQLLIPIIFSFYFFRNEDYFSSSLLLFWLSQNFFNVSVYAGDAVRMELPLLGGDGVGHDWNNMLSSIHLLNYTDTISSTIYFIGFIILVFAVVFSLRYSSKSKVISQDFL